MRPAFALLLIVACVLGLATSAAAAPPATSASATAPPVEVEEVQPDSPRASVQHFLELAKRSDYAGAALYIEVPRGEKHTAADLARQLYVVLARFASVDVEQLSPHASGKKEDRLTLNVDEVTRLRDRAGKVVPMRVVRREAQGDTEGRWVFTAQSVAGARELYDGLEDRWLREHLPAPLLREGPKSLLIWQWLAIPLLFFACFIVGRLLGSLTTAIARAIAKRTKPLWDDLLSQRLTGPIGLGWALLLFAVFLPRLALYLAAEDFVLRLVHATSFGAFFWALIKAVRVVGDVVEERSRTGKRPSMVLLSELGQRAGRIAIAVIGTVAVINELGYPVASLITGLGIGGIAIALAAQKTVENLFGSVSILADQPFKVGETLKVDGIEGTVETIGLRSTRIRTSERTLVIIPNGKLADMRIEAFGSRDRFRCLVRVALAPETPRAIAETLAADIESRWGDHDAVPAEDIAVGVKAWSENGMELEATAYVLAPDLVHFTRIRHELILRASEAVSEAGATLAQAAPLVRTAAQPVG